MLTKLKSTHEALRKTAASLLDRARQAAADATAARSMAADSFAAGSDDAARTALTRAAVRAAEAEALTAAAGETEARACGAGLLAGAAEPFDAPGPFAFSTPSTFAAGPISPRRLGQLVSAQSG